MPVRLREIHEVRDALREALPGARRDALIVAIGVTVAVPLVTAAAVLLFLFLTADRPRRRGLFGRRRFVDFGETSGLDLSIATLDVLLGALVATALYTSLAKGGRPDRFTAAGAALFAAMLVLAHGTSLRESQAVFLTIYGVLTVALLLLLVHGHNASHLRAVASVFRSVPLFFSLAESEIDAAAAVLHALGRGDAGGAEALLRSKGEPLAARVRFALVEFGHLVGGEEPLRLTKKGEKLLGLAEWG